MSAKIRVLVATLMCAAVMLFCATAGSENAAAQLGNKTVTVTFADSGSSVNLARGDTLIVRLEGNVGTGYSWTLAKNDSKVLALQSQSTERENNVPGGKYFTVMRFKSASAGSNQLEVNYSRSFERKPPAKMFRLRVNVQ